MACRRSRKRTVQHIQKIAASLHRAMPEYSVETLFETRNSLSNTTRVSVSDLYQMKPIAFRLTSASSAKQIFFGQSKRSRKLKLIGSMSRSTNSLLHLTSPGVPSHRNNNPLCRERLILDSRPTTRYHACPHPQSRRDQKKLESVRWSILAKHRTSKVCSRSSQELAPHDWHHHRRHKDRSQRYSALRNET